jgi:pyridoxal phosphate enzyme (YggS family)
MDFVGNPHTIDRQSCFPSESSRKTWLDVENRPVYFYSHMSAVLEQLSQNLKSILDEMHSACQRSGRDKSSVRLVAVTKYAEWPWVQALSSLYQTFGENRPQQLADRQEMLPEMEWHLIGQLQRNKVRLALQHATLIHSVDSLKLLERIEETASSMNKDAQVLLQVNASGEASKSGFTPEEITHEWPTILAKSSRTRISGLMTMAPESENPEDARTTFQKLRQLRDHLAARDDSRESGVLLSELSMGMSGDFIPAIEEGATLVRIGSRIFQGLQPTGPAAT